MKPAGSRLTPALACVLAVTLTACSSSGAVEPQPDSSGSSDAPSAPLTPPASEVPPAPVAAGDVRLGDREWQYSTGGVDLPITVSLVDGKAEIDGVTYTLGDTVFSDANGDGSPDIAAQINRGDGNGYESLWYLWVLDTNAADEASAVTQVPYPIARAARCGTTINAVHADPAGFAMDESIRLPWTDDAVPCSDPGTGVRTRTITLTSDGDGGYFPVQLSPTAEWGGICPGSEWLDGIEEKAKLWSAPADSAPIAVSQDIAIGVYELNPAPQLEALRSSDWIFVGFSNGEDTDPVQLHCGFAARPAG